MAQQDLEKMSEKEFLNIVSDIGIAIACAADAYRKLNPDPNIAFGEACGMVIGMALNASSDHDNSIDILQAAVTLKVYAQSRKNAGREDYDTVNGKDGRQ